MMQVLRALLSHWRKRPLQLFALLCGLTVATALWSGVQALNAQARGSYDQAAQMLGGDRVESLALVSGGRFSDEVFADLRRAGWAVSPVLEGRVRVGGVSLRVLGIEPLSLPAAAAVSPPGAGGESEDAGNDFAAFLTPPWRVLVASATADSLGGNPVTDAGRVLPEVMVTEGLAPGTLVMDIAAAQAVLDAPGLISRLLIDPEAPASAVPLVEATDIALQPVPEDVAAGDLDRLTDSFHLNLTAFGLLAFLVGLFIVYSAVTLAFEQRLPMLRTLRACGVSARGLTVALLAELLTLALVGGVLGVALGYLIAAALMPDVAASLGGLYGAKVPGVLSLSPSWWAAGLGMSLLGALGASAYSLARAYTMSPLATAQRFAWREAQVKWLRWQAVLAGALAVAAVLLALFGDGLVTGFAMLAAVLLAGALALPPLLSLVLRWGEDAARKPLAQWFWADSRMQLSGLSVALMALLLALAANIGVGTMVDGFRKTFTDWLDQRLIAEVYLNPGDAQRNQAMLAFLEAQDEVRAVLPTIQAEARVEGWPVTVVGFVDDASYRDHWPMKAETPDIWQALASGEGLVVSEQLAVRLGTRLDARLDLGDWQPRVVGIYPDYGNPKGQISANLETVRERFDDARPAGIGVRTAPDDIAPMIETLRERFDLTDTQIIDQASLKAFSKGIFEKTFAVTAALNVLTMVVAGIAMLMSLLTLSEMRLPQLAPLWAGGLTRRRLAALEMGKTLALALFTALLAIPLGLAVAWCLVAVVNVQAFGWRLPLHVFPLQWLVMVGLAVVTALLASLVPTLRLRTMPPMRLLRVFADER